MESTALTRLSALAHPQRLALFRLLVRRYPDAVSAGDLAQAIGAKSSTLSVYLSTLRQAGLIRQSRQGTSLLYAAEMTGVEGLMSYLFDECCRGRGLPCDVAPPSLDHGRKFNVLFLCTGNSARSIFAEAILRQIAGARFNVYSAGTDPAATVNPHALRVLKRHGHDLTGLRPKHLSEFEGPDAPRFDFVFTVCDSAAHVETPRWAGHPLMAHWGQPDPVADTSPLTDGQPDTQFNTQTEAERQLAFHEAYQRLQNRIRPFAQIDFTELDRMTAQVQLDAIARDLLITAPSANRETRIR